MKLSDKTLAANSMSLDKFEDSAAAKIGGAIEQVGKSIEKATDKAEGGNLTKPATSEDNGSEKEKEKEGDGKQKSWLNFDYSS